MSHLHKFSSRSWGLCEKSGKEKVGGGSGSFGSFGVFVSILYLIHFNFSHSLATCVDVAHFIATFFSCFHPLGCNFKILHTLLVSSAQQSWARLRSIYILCATFLSSSTSLLTWVIVINYCQVYLGQWINGSGFFLKTV